MPLLPAAIAIVLNNDQTEVLLIKRKDTPIWVLPGGGIEPGEKEEEALIREVKEETGFDVQITRKCAEYTPINRLASFTSVFVCHIQSGKMELSDETRDIGFFPINHPPPSLCPPHIVWLKEALSQTTLIQRALIEVNYWEVCKYFFLHPFRILRLIWTRITRV